MAGRIYTDADVAGLTPAPQPIFTDADVASIAPPVPAAPTTYTDADVAVVADVAPVAPLASAAIAAPLDGWLTDIQVGLEQAGQIPEGLRLGRNARIMNNLVPADAEASVADPANKQIDEFTALLSNVPEGPARDQALGVIAQMGAARDSDIAGVAPQRLLREQNAETARQDSLPDIASVMASNARIAEFPTNEAFTNMTLPEATWGEAWRAAKSDPSGVVRTAFLRSLPSMAPTIAATVAATAVAGPTGGAIVAGVTGGATEYASTIAGEISPMLQAAGVDATDQAAVLAFLETNPELLNAAANKGLIRGAVIGGFDTLTGGATGALARAAATSGRATRTATAAAGGVVEALGEGAGEALAMAATGDEISPGEILAEIAGGAGPGAITTAGQMAVQAASAAETRAADNAKLPGVIPDRLNTADVDAPTYTDADVADVVDVADADPIPEPAPTGEQQNDPTANAADPVEANAPQSAGPTENASPEAAAQPAEQSRPTVRVFTPDNKEVEVATGVVEADTLLTSDQEAYPQELQPRDRDRAASQTQIESIANAPNPRRLDQSPETSNGSPIIGPDGVVESGNGRTIGLRRAYERGTADEYRAYVTEQFPEAANMRNPVIVRRRVTDVDRRDFASASNQSTTLEMSATETAQSDARQINDDVIGLYRGGPIGSAQNRDMVRAFIGRLPQSSQNALTTKEGGLSIEGQRRFQSALFQRAYGDEKLLTSLTENPDDDIRSITTALADAAPEMVRLRNAIDGGVISPDVDISADVASAVRAVRDIRARDQNLRDDRAQIDALAEPRTPAAEAILSALYNPAGTRIASKAAIQRFLTAYTERAMKQNVDQATLPGVEAAPLKNREEILNETAAAQSDDDSGQVGQLLDAPQGSSGGRSAGRGGRGAQRTADGGSRIETPARSGRNQDAADDVELADAAPSDAPKMSDSNVAEGTENSIYEEAYRDAGMTPDEGVLLPPARKRRILADLLASTFGIKVNTNVKGKPLSTIDVASQLLDAYRNIRYMTNALGLPHKALSLGGRLTLALEGRGRGKYLGLYDSSTTTIHMPGRSNSFAHEWLHALDHYLRDTIKPGAMDYLLSKVARVDGLDVYNGLEEAFANLLNVVFFDESSFAAKALALETAASATFAKGPQQGQPTKAAITAQGQLDRLMAGNTRSRIQPSKFRTGSLIQNNAGYFASAHEMLARSFEAYIAHKVDLNGGGNSFITKGERAYLSDGDNALANLYPKAEERLRIFQAFDVLFDHIRDDALLANPADAVGAQPADVDIHDPKYWNKVARTQGEKGFTAQTIRGAVEAAAGLRDFIKGNLGGRSRSAVSLSAMSAAARRSGFDAGAQGIPNALRQAARLTADVTYRRLDSARANANLRLSRQPKDAQLSLQLLVDKLMTQNGSGRDMQHSRTFEDARERETLKIASDIGDVISVNGFSLERLSKADNDTLRALMYGEDVPGATSRHKAVAATMRRIMDRIHRRAVNVGMSLGYVEDKGYLPRSILPSQVEARKDEFIKKATKVYGLVFEDLMANAGVADVAAMATGLSNRLEPGTSPRQNGPFSQQLAQLSAARKAKDDDAIAEAREALEDAIKLPFSDFAARDWASRIIIGDTLTFDSLGPETQFTKARTLPAETDEILGDFYNDDVLDLVMQYAGQTETRIAYVERFGQTNGNKDFATMQGRPEVQAAINRNPTKYDPDTAQGRANILRDLADVKVDNIVELIVREGENQGADRDATWMRGLVEDFTGASASGFSQREDNTLASAMRTLTYLKLLGKASWSSIAEPTAVILRTGSFKAAGVTYRQYAREAFRSAETTQDVAQIARAIGLVTNQLHDSVLMNRLGGDFDRAMSGNTMLMSFFKTNLLTQLTNAQRRATMVGGTYWIRQLYVGIEKAGTADPARVKILQAELADLGVGDNSSPVLAAWFKTFDDLPSITDLESAGGKIYADAVARFVDQTIQNPRRADKTLISATPMGSAMFGLTAFLYAFFQNVHVATAKRGVRNYRLSREAGSSKAGAAADAAIPFMQSFVAGFATLFVAQMAVTIAREALFSGEKWDELEEEGDDALFNWLAIRSLSRTGVAGPLDILANTVLGVRFQRDLANTVVGPGVGSTLQNVTSMANGWFGIGQNSPNTNTAERQAAIALYRELIVPVSAVVLSSTAKKTPLGYVLPFLGIQYSSSGDAAQRFANKVVGEKE